MSPIDAYRTRHVIKPKIAQDPALGRIWTCEIDGLRIIMRRNGWRHEPTAVKKAAAQ